MTKVTPDDLAALVQIFDSSDWQEMHLTLGETELFLSKNANAVAPGRAVAMPAFPVQALAPPPAASALAASAPYAPAGGGGAVPTGWTTIRAPNLGTFYRAPKPGAPPYVELGQSVTPETEVCLIEVMKLFTPVRAGVAGIIRQACVGDSELVEYDQLLFLVEPHA